MGISKTISTLVLAATLTACGSGGGNNTDTSAPAAPTTSGVTNASDGSITIAGTAEANSTVEVTFPDGSKKTVIANSAGSYSLTSALPQPSGNVVITSTDSGGNTSGATTVAYLDTSAPAAPTTSGVTNASDGSITIAGTAEANSTVEVTFPDGSKKTVIANSAGSYSLTSTPLQPSGNVAITSTDSGGNTSGATTVAHSTIPEAPTTSSVTTASDGSITISGTAEANSTIEVTFPDGSTQTVIADSDGNYSLTSAPLQPSGGVSITSSDSQGNTSPPTALTNIASYDTIKANYLVSGVMPALGFSPSLGINTEAPQGGADTAGMPMPFVDIFRTARPFAELSPPETTIDENGWPTEFASGETYAKSKLLQGAMDDSIPEGQYTVLYEGSGDLEFSGSVSNVTKIPGENKYTIDLELNDFDGEDEVAASDTNAFNMNVRNILPGDGNYMKNIRIVMPGGTCTGNPYIHIKETETCPSGTTYESFAERLETDRNAIIFNPDYLLFLRNFKVIRMMNLMEASLKSLCDSSDNCPAGVGTWDYRAKMDDAVWGGNDGRTNHEDHKGVPIEVMVDLANILKRDIWVNMPHIASDDYVSNYADYVYQNLDSTLKVYVEYSNEVWNSGFAGHAYVVSEGNKLGLNTVPAEFEGYRTQDYFSRLRFYSKRSVEIFELWEAKFASSSTRLERVLGSFVGDKVLTEQMLKYLVSTGDADHVDSVAIAPYFFGCPYEAACTDAEQTLIDATSVDEVFVAIDQDRDVDVKSLDGTIAAVENQLAITNNYNKKLVTYEGGQHLVTGVFGSYGDNLTTERKAELRGLFNEANRDPRMKDRYVSFLNAWKDLPGNGATLFTLYTLPQSFYRYGNFGIKEHLNMPRSESPKFDGAMTFQEAVETCWWDDCSL